jgi:hypothetical protein
MGQAMSANDFTTKDVHRSTQTITEMVTGRRVVWRVLDAEINFVKDTGEWNGTAPSSTSRRGAARPSYA